MLSLISWEILAIIIGGVLTIILAVKSAIDAKKSEENLAISNKKADRFQHQLLKKQEEFIALQDSLQVKSDQIIMLQGQLSISAEKIISTQQESLNNITGGNSFPIVNFSKGLESTLWVYISNAGKYKLSDINITVIDVNRVNQLTAQSIDGSFLMHEAMTIYTLKHVNPNHIERLGTFKVYDIKAELIHITTSSTLANGTFYQNTFIRERNGKFSTAVEIRKTVDKKVVYTHIDEDFLNPGEEKNKYFRIDF